MAKIRVRLVKSLIRCLPRHRATVRALGLRKIGSYNDLEANPSVMGMVRAVAHLVSVEEIA
ncbi:MAG: 50S ribosomal protein L30 [Treponema sp.]|nr:50S ribosomal protein L30 [Treponema sp.]